MGYKKKKNPPSSLFWGFSCAVTGSFSLASDLPHNAHRHRFIIIIITIVSEISDSVRLLGIYIYI